MQRAQYADLKVYLPNDPLVKVDRMSMAHRLEIRCPLLDHRIVELAFRIPTAMKLATANKIILKGLARRRAFSPGAQAKTRFYSASWRVVVGPLRRAFRRRRLSCSATSRDLVDPTRVRQLFTEHQSGRDTYAFWAVWMLERWARFDLAAN